MKQELKKNEGQNSRIKSGPSLVRYRPTDSSVHSVTVPVFLRLTIRSENAFDPFFTHQMHSVLDVAAAQFSIPIHIDSESTLLPLEIQSGFDYNSAFVKQFVKQQRWPLRASQSIRPPKGAMSRIIRYSSPEEDGGLGGLDIISSGSLILLLIFSSFLLFLSSSFLSNLSFPKSPLPTPIVAPSLRFSNSLLQALFLTFSV